jgi:AcrR family transcriptional regulator
MPAPTRIGRKDSRRPAPGAKARRTPLTRRRILEAALALIDAEGLQALTMRRLGGELGVEAMSIYNHVPHKEAVLDGVAEIMLEEVELPPVHHDDWIGALKTACRSFRRVLLDHPNAMPLIGSRTEVTPEGFRPVELSLGILKKAGFDAESMLLAHWLLVGYTLGHAGFQVSTPLADPEAAPAEIAKRHQLLDADEFPNLFEALPYAAGCDFEAAYEFGLDTIIEGLKARLG